MMEPTAFVEKWTASKLKESAGAQEHFDDLCRLLVEPTPVEADPEGKDYAREYGATKSTGGNGFADVFKRGHFGWEYKGPGKNLDAAYDQLLRYAVALDNPPLLVVSDTKRIVIHTNFTNTVRETHELDLDDLLDGAKRDLLKAVFSDPEALKPKKTRQDLTRQAANEFSVLAQRLRERGHAPEAVAHFVNRLVFCMFAEDVGLLPNKLFQRAMEVATDDPAEAQDLLVQLFRAMNQKNGRVGYDKVPWFNGGLFDTDEALVMDKGDVALALKAAKLDWSDIDPSILGTLFERGLDPSKRSQLGAHYTDREKIMMIVDPVIVRPLTAEWEEAKATIATEMEKAAGTGRAATNARKRAEGARDAFLERLAAFRVLDPACGSGNFLYLSLLALKDIEHRANLDAEALGLPRGFPRVGPEAVRGIEINPYAAELARVSVWIGEIQWMRRNGFAASTNPVLRPLDHIECRDAVLAYDEDGTPVQAVWPEADVIVGNPPFLGSKFFRKGKPATKKGPATSGLGDGYTNDLQAAFKNAVPGSANLVAYWFFQATRCAPNSLASFGFVFTRTALKGVSNNVLRSALTSAEMSVCTARSDEQWVIDGAAVRVALVHVAKHGTCKYRELNGETVANLNSDLSTGVDVTGALKLEENRGISFQGVKQNGPFSISNDTARHLLAEPSNPNGRHNADVIRRLAENDDVTVRNQDSWIIDFTNHSTVHEAALYEKPFKLTDRVRAHREELSAGEATEERLQKYWLMQRPRTDFRDAIKSLDGFIAVPETSEHLIFRLFDSRYLISGSLFGISRYDYSTFGILSSKFHSLWSAAKGNTLGVGNQSRYNATSTFETYPFPEGLTPDIPAEEYADDPRAVAIAEAAKTLDEQRERWLNPPEWTARVPEVVPGYPDRVVPKDEEAAKHLKKRTLTKLYNERPAWLDNAHRDLDRAVAAAYGWAEDFEAGSLTETEVLARLFALNQARAGA